MIPQHSSALFISDLHLTPSMPLTAQRFFDFCEKEASNVEAVFILGDLFEYWVGDDANVNSPFQQEVKRTLLALSSRVKTYYLHGNRDFLIGADFLLRTGMTLIPDPSKILICGDEFVLSHGDMLCTADVGYQIFRSWVHKPWLQTVFLKMPVKWRRNIANNLRSNSTAKYQRASRYTPDIARIRTNVTQNACAALMKDQAATKLIHGHTHMPARHHESQGEYDWQRWVLSDWDLDHPESILPKASALQIDENGIRYLDLVKS